MYFQLQEWGFSSPLSLFTGGYGHFITWTQGSPATSYHPVRRFGSPWTQDLRASLSTMRAALRSWAKYVPPYLLKSLHLRFWSCCCVVCWWMMMVCCWLMWCIFLLVLLDFLPTEIFVDLLLEDFFLPDFGGFWMLFFNRNVCCQSWIWYHHGFICHYHAIRITMVTMIIFITSYLVQIHKVK